MGPILELNPTLLFSNLLMLRLVGFNLEIYEKLAKAFLKEKLTTRVIMRCVWNRRYKCCKTEICVYLGPCLHCIKYNLCELKGGLLACGDRSVCVWRLEVRACLFWFRGGFVCLKTKGESFWTCSWLDSHGSEGYIGFQRACIILTT